MSFGASAYSANWRESLEKDAYDVVFSGLCEKMLSFKNKWLELKTCIVTQTSPNFVNPIAECEPKVPDKQDEKAEDEGNRSPANAPDKCQSCRPASRSSVDADVIDIHPAFDNYVSFMKVELYELQSLLLSVQSYLMLSLPPKRSTVTFKTSVQLKILSEIKVAIVACQNLFEVLYELAESRAALIEKGKKKPSVTEEMSQALYEFDTNVSVNLTRRFNEMQCVLIALQDMFIKNSEQLFSKLGLAKPDWIV